MGIDLKLITADEAYHDSDGSFFNETRIHLITPPSSKHLFPKMLILKPKRLPLMRYVRYQWFIVDAMIKVMNSNAEEEEN